MANRDSGAILGGADEAVFRALLARVARLEAQVRDLQARGDAMLPADFRYEWVAIGGQRAVVIRRVSTGATDQITDPM